MELERENLIKIMEAMMDTSYVLEKEMNLYRDLFRACCAAKGLTPEEIERAAQYGRTARTAEAETLALESHRSHVAAIPRIVDLLGRDYAQVLALVKSISPKGLPN